MQIHYSQQYLLKKRVLEPSLELEEAPCHITTPELHPNFLYSGLETTAYISIHNE